MSDSNSRANSARLTRRGFMKSAGSAATIGIFGISVVDARAEELPKLDESDPTAVALKYVHDASALSESIRPEQDRYCNNCALYAGSKEDEWAGCSLFPGKAVAGKGWCSVWAPIQKS